MTRDELNVEIEHVALLDALAAAKKGGKPDAVRTASLGLVAFRQKIRQAREDSNPGATIPTVAVKSKAGN